MSIYIGKSADTAELVAGRSGSSNNGGVVGGLAKKGYIMTGEPANPVKGDFWIKSNTLPSTFPVTITSVYGDISWSTCNVDYTPEMFDFWVYYNTSKSTYENYYRDTNLNKWCLLSDLGEYYTKPEVDAMVLNALNNVNVDPTNTANMNIWISTK